jgi:DegV family protein with EDD domain
MKIVTDGGIDLPEALLRECDAEILPLTLFFGSQGYRTGEIAHDDFYNRLRGGELATTSLPSVGEIAAVYRKIGDHDRDILSIHISSGLSGTFNTAQMAAKECPDLNITLVDTKTLSGAQGFQVLAAARALRQGKPLAAILKRIQQVSDAAETLYTLETLSYLQRGGRIGRVQAVASALLNIKPVITVDKTTGTYIAPGKARSMSKAIALVADMVRDKIGAGKRVWAIVLHGQIPQEAAQLAELLRQRVDCVYLEIARVAPVLGAHTGPGIVGVAFAPAEIMEAG